MQQLTDGKDAEQPEDAALHIIVVEENVGQMGGEQGINAPGGAHEVDVGVEDGCAQRARRHAGHVDQGHAP